MNIKLNKRDLVVIQFVAEQGPTRVSTVERYLKLKNLPTEKRQIRRILEKLALNGFLSRRQILSGSSIVWPTSKGLKLSGLGKTKIKVGSAPSMENLRHSIQVAEIRLIYEANGAQWNCERSIVNLFPNHLPDGLAVYEGQKILVEVDRTRKSHTRLSEIMKVNTQAFSSNAYVDYWVEPELFKFVESHKELLPDGTRNRIRIFEIPGEIRK
jgi:hypothetical protein